MDGRKKETEIERREITTSDWLRDRLKLMLSHYSCLAKQEMTKAVIQLGRFSYSFGVIIIDQSEALLGKS